MASTDKQPTLHHLNNSQSQRVLWLLEELEIPYNLVLHTRDSKTHLAPQSLKDATPYGKAPTLVTSEGVPIVESSAIIAYLIKTYDHAHKFQGADLNDHDPFVRDEVLTSFCSATIGPLNLMKTFISMGALTDNTGGRVIEPRILNALEYLEAELGDQDYFMGTSPGRPDFMISWPIDSIVQKGIAPIGPRLTSWRERILARDGWKRALDKGQAPYDLTSFSKK